MTAFSKTDDVILFPILRAGLAMWRPAADYFENAESAFIICHKNKGTPQADVVWLSNPDLRQKTVILLDVICATGDTVNAVVNEMHKRFSDTQLNIHVVSCYASPEACAALEKNPHISQVHVGVLSETVNKDGYMIPLTNGDAGDKLFGEKGQVRIEELKMKILNTGAPTPRAKL